MVISKQVFDATKIEGHEHLEFTKFEIISIKFMTSGVILPIGRYIVTMLFRNTNYKYLVIRKHEDIYTVLILRPMLDEDIVMIIRVIS